MTQTNLNNIAIQLTDRKYLNYAISLTSNREDAEDLINDAVLAIYKSPETFIAGQSGQYLESLLKKVIKNLFIDRCRRKKEIDKARLSDQTAKFTRDKKYDAALERIIEDKDKNDYYPLLMRRVLEWGGVKQLSKASGVNENTIYTGIKKYKKDLMSIKKILIVGNKESGVGYHRIVKPYSELRLTRNDILVTLSNAYVNRDHDIVVFNRLIGTSYDDDRAIFREMKICGQKVIVDIDDYWILPHGHHLEHYYAKNGITKRIMQNIREADIVTTTNEVLALKILKLNKSVVILPNAVNENDLQWMKMPVEFNNTYRFGYAGSAAHTIDVPILRKSCNLMHRGKQNFEMVLLGWNESDPQRRLFAEILSGRDLKSERFSKLPQKSPLEYGMMYNMISCSLAPLADNLFNRCKSNLKIVEASIHGIPIICSKVHPYFGSDFDNSVLFAETEYDWYKRMISLLKDRKMGEEMAESARQIVLKKYTYKNVTPLRSEII